jgi:hypothetical protein
MKHPKKERWFGKRNRLFHNINNNIIDKCRPESIIHEKGLFIYLFYFGHHTSMNLATKCMFFFMPIKEKFINK